MFNSALTTRALINAWCMVAKELATFRTNCQRDRSPLLDDVVPTPTSAGRPSYNSLCLRVFQRLATYTAIRADQT